MTEEELIIEKNKENIERSTAIFSDYQNQYMDGLNVWQFRSPMNYLLSEKTYSNEEESRDDAINKIILQELKEFRLESKDGFESLEEANIKITNMQEELKINTQTISDLLLARKNAKKIYFLGLFTGIASGIGGAVFNNFIYIIVGIGIALTAITGLWEAKQNEW